MISPKHFEKRIRSMDHKLRVSEMAGGGYRISRDGREVCQATTLGSHVETALQKGSMKRNPNVWTDHMQDLKARNAARDQEARQTMCEGRAELARALAFDLHNGNRVGSTARFRANFDTIFRKEQNA
jgi:hypothetical protein